MTTTGEYQPSERAREALEATRAALRGREGCDRCGSPRLAGGGSAIGMSGGRYMAHLCAPCLNDWRDFLDTDLAGLGDEIDRLVDRHLRYQEGVGEWSASDRSMLRQAEAGLRVQARAWIRAGRA